MILDQMLQQAGQQTAGAGRPIMLKDKSCPRGKQTVFFHCDEVKARLCTRCTTKSISYTYMLHIYTEDTISMKEVAADRQ